MNNFFQKTGQFFLNLLAVCLILLISFQIVSKMEADNSLLRKIGNHVQKVWEKNDKTDSFLVFEQRAAGYITIDLMQDYSLPEVWVMKNGVRIANFARGIVEVEVTDGDYISIDARAYTGILWFKITSLSSNIINYFPGQLLRSSGNFLELGIIDIYNKL